LFSSVGLSQTYWWDLKQNGSSLGGPIDVANYNTDIVYYGSDNRIYKSIDRGETFSFTGTAVPGAFEIKCIILHNTIPETFLVAVESAPDRIWKTTDDGQTWSLSLDNASFSFFGIPMEQDPSNPETIYTMSNIEFMRSINFGARWITISTSTGLSSAPCDIEKFPNSDVILLGDNTVGVVKSADGGFNWSQKYSTSGEIPTIAVSHTDPGVAFATKWGGGGGFIKSTDYGETWSDVSGFNTINMWGVDIQETDGNIVIAGCFLCTSGTWRSINGGDTWTQINIPSTNYQIEITDSITQYSAQGAGFYKLESDFFVPVELSSFTAEVSENQITLLWTTASELNNQGFDIEISYNNEDFNRIGFVLGFGTTAESKNYLFNITEFVAGTQYFRLKQIDYDGTFTYTNAIEVEGFVPASFSLSQNYPNPFNPSTIIRYGLDRKQFVSLKVYDVLGNEIAALVNEEKSAGSYEVEFSENTIDHDLTSGIYIYTLTTESFRATKKMLLMK
jgi:hypothetical protein